jgi:HTH DNA binding domain
LGDSEKASGKKVPGNVPLPDADQPSVITPSRLICDDAAEIGVSCRAAHNLLSELGVREITGSGRFRAWSVM